ncbi:MAG: hypothetical protein Q7W30_03675 [Coriobacteriia bacterium]|nr:hypothetical protein [Coriobacteriia bacterium]
MAETDSMPHVPRPPRYDGAPHCVLCGSTDLHTGHEWCTAADFLVCDACCDELLRGEDRRRLAIHSAAGKTITRHALFAVCSHCERGHRRIAQDLLRMEDSDASTC